ncbi:MAG: hypothetical protein WC866_06250 [Patescibacteria group bacterium]|jgi:hypothetical protein
MRDHAPAIVVCVVLVVLLIVYFFIGRRRWGLVKEGMCTHILRRDYVCFAAVCPYTYDDLYSDETDTDFHFEDGTFTVACKAVHYDGPLPAHIRLEVNWLGSYRVVPTTQKEKAA